MQRLKRKPMSEKLESIVRSLLTIVRTVKLPTLSLERSLKVIVFVTILILILLLLLGCSPRHSVILPPEAAPRPMPPLYGTTGVDALAGIPLYREWGLSCEADKAVIRALYGKKDEK